MQLSQEKIVFVLWVAAFAAFSVLLPGFLSSQNILTLVRGVSVLGILALGMSVVVIGRGIDLSMIATMAVSAAFSFFLIGNGHGVAAALLSGLALALVCGAISGLLIAFVEIPALFATLAMAALIYGFGRFALFPSDVIPLPPTSPFLTWLGGGFVGPVPVPVILFALSALIAALALRFFRLGRFIYATGDNPEAARVSGLPYRPLLVLQYMTAASISFFAGVVTGAGVASINTRIVNSTLLYDVILVVVLGGISLSGGKGGVRNVIVGTLLIGTLLNGMTIMDIQLTMQNLIKSLILLAAIVADSLLNPRDEQTAQQGDI